MIAFFIMKILVEIWEILLSSSIERIYTNLTNIVLFISTVIFPVKIKYVGRCSFEFYTR